MLAFTLAVFFLLITPGPGVLSVAGVGAGFGYRPGAYYIWGLFAGTNLVALTVVTGLAALIVAEPRVRTLLFVASFAYLVYLALRVALAGSQIGFSARADAPGIRDGIILQFLNPKAYAVNTALFTGFPIFADAYWTEVALKFVVVNAIWLPIHFLWLWLGVRLHALALPYSTQRWINYAMAAAMLAVVVLAALSS